MYTLILAAGQGSRLGLRAAGGPKCLVELGGHSLLDRAISALAVSDDLDLHIIASKGVDQLAGRGCTVIDFPDASSTNIVGGLVRGLAAGGWPSEALVLYGDVVFEPVVIERTLAAQPADVVLPINSEWERLWRLRMPDPLADAETLRLSPDRSRVTEIGGQPRDLGSIEGQFMGVMRLGSGAIASLRATDDAVRDHMDVTTWLSSLLGHGLHIRPVQIPGGWLEIDTEADLLAYEDALVRGVLDEYCRL